MIELTDITRVYHLGETEVRALDGVSAEIADGEHVAIMGPSGSGKSTLLNVVGCLDRPTSGSYQLNGVEVSSLDDHDLTRIRREEIGFVFQFFHLVPRLTARENVELPLLFAGVARRERQRASEAALAAVGLSTRAEHHPAELSGGERQRVALARATILNPTILLADEPTGNLDSASGRAVLDLLDRLNEEGQTIVVVTHDPKVASRADRIVVLIDGRIVREVEGGGINEVMQLLAGEEEA